MYNFILHPWKTIKNTLAAKIILAFITLVFILFLIRVSQASSVKLKELNSHTFNDSLFLKKDAPLIIQEETDSLAKELAEKAAFLSMASNDKIGLYISLQDSMARLTIKGVTIHSTRLTNFKIDPVLKKLHKLSYYRLFKQPLRISSERATIVKEPIVVRKAPKDSVEAAKNVYKPDTLIQNPAFLELLLNEDIQLVFQQDSCIRSIDKQTKRKFTSQRNLYMLRLSVKEFISFRKISYRPTIRIDIPADDLRSIYRALPEEGEIVVAF